MTFFFKRDKIFVILFLSYYFRISYFEEDKVNTIVIRRWYNDAQGRWNLLKESVFLPEKYVVNITIHAIESTLAPNRNFYKKCLHVL